VLAENENSVFKDDQKNGFIFEIQMKHGENEYCIGIPSLYLKILNGK